MVTISPTPQWIEQATAPQLFPDFTLQYWYPFQAPDSIDPNAPIHTYQIDFQTPTNIYGPDIKDALQQSMDVIKLSGQTPILFALWQAPSSEISIPDQICVFDLCWTPPWAGNTLVTMNNYKLYLVTQEGVFGSVAVRPQFPWATVARYLFILVLVPAGAAILGMFQGTATWKDVSEQVRLGLDSILPGGQAAKVTSSLTGPLIAFGIAAVAAGIFIPYLQASTTARLPLPGGGSVESTVGSGARSGGRRGR